jgi:hypothetical protein
MIYIEMTLEGRVNVYDMTERLFLLRAAIEAKAAALPVPTTLQEAQEFRRAGCYQFEMFCELDDADAWADAYSGFRAEEVRKELARFIARREAHGGPLAA